MKSGEFITAASDPESLVEQLLSTQLDSSLPRSAAAEQRSWKNSLPVLAEDLAAAGLMDVDIFLEFPLPMSSQRIDALLAGTHPVTGNPSFVLLRSDPQPMCYSAQAKACLGGKEHAKTMMHPRQAEPSGRSSATLKLEVERFAELRQ